MMKLTADEMRLNIKNKLRNLENDGEGSIKDDLNKLLKTAGVDYEVLTISIGGISPPQEVLNESERTAAQVQRIETETQKDLAEKARKNAESSRAAADKEYINQMNLNPAQFVTLEGYVAYKYAAEKCAAGTGCTMIVGSPGVAPVLPIK